MEIEANLIANELRTSKFIKQIMDTKARRFSKTTEASEKARREGNILYGKNNHTSQMHEEILKCYSKSVALAPKNSEDLALAYGNRSAFLLHVQKYKECIEDIDRALKITNSISLKEKLQKRRSESLTSLGSEVISKISLDDSKKENSIDSIISIKYNDKYGRHLVANRDIKPGEIIFKAEPYVACLNIMKPYVRCCHCLSVAWTGIPCDNCSWFIFCSEKCKKEACEQYHDIECSCVPYVMHYLNYIAEETQKNTVYDGISIKALIKGLREIGSFEDLKTEIRNIDMNPDKMTKGFSKNGKFENNSFRSLYGLSTDIPINEMDGHVTFAAVTLICLVKYTNLFGNDCKSFEVEKIINNVDMMFIGSLLLKLSKISNINSHSILNVNDDCKHSNDIMTCRKNGCCVKGICIVPLASLTNHSCNPNARRCFTDDQKFILYALKPIKKNSQIFDSYFCTFFETPNPYRRDSIKENFNFTCYCMACKENWPAWPIVDTVFQELIPSVKMNSKEIKVWERNKEMIESIEKGTAEYNQNFLLNVSKAVEGSLKILPQSSIITCKLTFVLIQVFEKIYGYKTQIFNNC